MEINMTDKELLALAHKARERSYCPYSSFAVGAALLAKSGKVYLGANVENASFGATNCAERSAIFSAISSGEREFFAIAIVGGKVGEDTTDCLPCGICRQVMAEFCDADFKILLEDKEKKAKVITLSELLPHSFELKK